ncbi:MAG TPA: 50S ribosomal protein L11 methyltransferase [Allosphingosinicella sp.]|nr:50S ribosomal protein L11 methyltransferase [Allosphingosinicella sp.]
MCWKVTLPCTRAEAEALAGDIAPLAMLDSPPVLMTSEPDPERPDDWRLDAYFEDQPGPEDIALLRDLLPSAAGETPLIEALEEQDWVRLSQAGLEPIRAGRFFVHTPAHRDEVPAHAVAFEIDAGRAFGTGQHETTTGCLIALDRLKATGASFADIADIGTGTGLLAFAAMQLWPAARAVASDIDPVAIEVAEENARINQVKIGRARGQLELAVAAGLDHPRLKARAPYDLIIANILAGPLIELAPALAGALAPGGRLILAGLLDTQAEAVRAAYRRQGMMAGGGVQRGDWPTLVLRKRKSTGWR